MRFLYPLSFLFFNTYVLANTQHITPLVTINTEQDSGVGYGFSYQYELFEGIDMEAIYLKSNELSTATSDNDLTGKFDSFLIGVNAIKPYNEDLHFKLGGGLGYVFNSKNESLVTDKKISPYLKFTFNYRVSNQASIEFGQISQKVDGQLSASHTFFAGLSWQFGHRSQLINDDAAASIPKQTQASLPPVYSEAKKVEQAPVTHSQTLKTKVLSPPPTPWYLQLGAFKNISNATNALTNYQKRLPQLQLTLAKLDDFYRLVSYGLTDKQSAEALQQNIHSNFDIITFIVHLPDLSN